MRHKKIGLFVNRQKDKDLEITRTVVDCALKYSVKPLLLESIAKDIGFLSGIPSKKCLSKLIFQFLLVEMVHC